MIIEKVKSKFETDTSFINEVQDNLNFMKCGKEYIDFINQYVVDYCNFGNYVSSDIGNNHSKLGEIVVPYSRFNLIMNNKRTNENNKFESMLHSFCLSFLLLCSLFLIISFTFVLINEFIVAVVNLFNYDISHYTNFITGIIILISFFVSFIKSLNNFNRLYNETITTIQVSNENYLVNSVEKQAVMVLFGLMIKDFNASPNKMDTFVHYMYFSDTPLHLNHNDVYFIHQFIIQYNKLKQQRFSLEEIQSVMDKDIKKIQSIFKNALLNLNQTKAINIKVLKQLEKLNNIIEQPFNTNNIHLIADEKDIEIIWQMIDKIEEKVKHAPELSMPVLKLNNLIHDNKIKGSDLFGCLDKYHQNIMKLIAQSVL